MTGFRVESVRINTSLEKAFQYIAAPQNLPHWTHAFQSVRNGTAVMATPAGTVEVNLGVRGSQTDSTIDWRMTFPDGTVASAFSRLIPEGREACIYSFVLLAPPVALEQLEGALDEQARILREELLKLSEILSRKRD